VSSSTDHSHRGEGAHVEAPAAGQASAKQPGAPASMTNAEAELAAEAARKQLSDSGEAAARAELAAALAGAAPGADEPDSSERWRARRGPPAPRFGEHAADGGWLGPEHVELAVLAPEPRWCRGI
jgi:hypothetical protein